MQVSLYNRGWQIWTDTNMHVVFLTIFFLSILTGSFATENILSLIVLVMTIAFYLSYGFLVNDYFDKDHDIRAGKKRLMQELSFAGAWGALLGIVATGFLLASLFSRQDYLIVYLCAYLVGTFYSAPPLRFKDRGFWGLAADVMLEKTFPVLLVIVYFKYYDPIGWLFVITFSMYQFKVIVHHQLEDYGSDKKTGINTYVVQKGVGTSRRLLGTTIAFTFILMAVIIGIIALEAGPLPVIAGIYVLGLIANLALFKMKIIRPEDPVTPFYYKYTDVFLLVVMNFYLAFKLVFESTIFLILLIMLFASLSPRFSSWTVRILCFFK